MASDVFQILIVGSIVGVVWFVIGGVFYRNPWIAPIYDKAENSPGLKKWENMSKYLIQMFILGTLVQCVLWAFIFTIIEPVLFQDPLMKGFAFGIVLVFIKIIPRMLDMWLQTTYPNELLLIEFINGTIGSFIIGGIFAFLL